jgi:ceramide glucosyltransferase
VSILKPVCGDEALLEQAISSFCAQDYPAFQLVIGAQDAHDPALAVARRVAARFPQCDLAIVVDAARHGLNRKIENVMNMMPAAKHDVLVLADSDLHVRPDYLKNVVSALASDGVGLVTTIGCGEAAVPGIAAQLGAIHMSHIFLPGALMAVALGRQDCLGGTMALVGHVADDNVLGCLVRGLGLTVRIAPTLPVLTVQERSLRGLWQHELRWARTIRALTPSVFGCSVVQYPLFWSLAWVAMSGFGRAAITCFLVAWAVRAAVMWGIDSALADMRARPAAPVPVWLLPLRDVLSVVELAASYLSDQVVWRGQVMWADAGVPIAAAAGVLEETALDAQA